ncbi:MAG: YbaN family protein [Treponema sp.]|jgi:uncharacterized membrane protein YbaN (DUF454 family)|nr:YbaN family protein [Treponema sp.]
MKIQKILLIAAGFLLLGLAAAGIVLPVLPATPFLLAASFCFMKSSDRLHRWIMNSRFFGPRLARLKNGEGLTAKEKIIIYLTAFACIMPVIILTKSLRLRIFLAALLLVKAVVFLKMKTAKKETPEGVKS